MDSSPRAYRSSARGEKTGSSSRSSCGRSASAQSGLSRAASSATTSQSSVEEAGNCLHRPVDVLLGVRQRDEHRLELRGREVDAAVEQMPKQGAVALEVALLRLVEVPYRLLPHE